MSHEAIKAVMISAGSGLLFFGLLNSFIYLCFNERRMRLYIGIAMLLCGMLLFWYGVSQ